MIRPSLSTIGMIAAGIVLPLATAAALSTAEPQNGFVRGPRPSWSAAHINAGTQEHVEFHQQAEVQMGLWESENADPELLRTRLRILEREHREFHHWTNAAMQQTQTEESPVSTPNTPAMGGDPTLNAIGSSPLWSEGFMPIYEELRYEGNRPSSRLLQDYARLRGAR